MGSTDIRWQQRLANYQRALAQLQAAVALQAERPLSELERQGLIQAFEFTHELAWNVMKDYFIYQGRSDLTGSRDATRAAFSVQLIEDGEGWMEMITSRNQSSHTYNRATAEALAECIVQRYAALFTAFAERMSALQQRDSADGNVHG
ncbi:MAG TPA: nucleotidyltransferase substrate binding protein [Burkholderiaceae bacterium]|nr:nucleotidyltransferase substrate binding protein [Burkholderiaceae bacterium]HMX10079.1 nucleotidyltransferase substrate binding protein [Burkholderiaceae bacterium]HMZ01220.1 nucleotidyltransferase substrate binding protein [Burkholderiaceae bacterium]HNB44409.1 nucleotidyltransferase substrate binding protein [Burkholderiaceae bacterium]HNG82096.1 nucleotidyltransferase substrate binding protein [Burkholderiaceae bacterium]